MTSLPFKDLYKGGNKLESPSRGGKRRSREERTIISISERRGEKKLSNLCEENGSATIYFRIVGASPRGREDAFTKGLLS